MHKKMYGAPTPHPLKNLSTQRTKKNFFLFFFRLVSKSDGRYLRRRDLDGTMYKVSEPFPSRWPVKRNLILDGIERVYEEEIDRSFSFKRKREKNWTRISIILLNNFNS